MRSRRGRLTVITGPMFAGKTSVLIGRARLVEGAHLIKRAGGQASVLALKPAFDTRSGAALIRSRDRSAMPALPIASWPVEAAGRAALVVDEAQFMTASHYAGDVVADVLAAVQDGASVTVSGLDTDYLRRPFEVIARLRAVADEQVVLRARCHVCGAPAAWTAKKAETGRLLEVGDEELYEARCDLHWSRPEAGQAFMADPGSSPDPPA